MAWLAMPKISFDIIHRDAKIGKIKDFRKDLTEFFSENPKSFPDVNIKVWLLFSWPKWIQS